MGELERRPNAWALTPLVVLIDLFGGIYRGGRFL